MIFVMVFIILGVLAVPYMWIIFSDDHHAVAYGATPEAASAAEPASAPAAEAIVEEAPAPEPAPLPAAAEEPAAPAAEPTPEPAATAAAPSEATEATPAPAAAEKAPAPEKKEEPPARVLPSEADVAAWANGADVDSIGTLLEDLPLKRFDAFNTKIRSKEILAQHWQVIAETEPPDEADFDALPEVGNLRKSYQDQELARRRLGALKVAWLELRGKPPGLWQVPDLMAAIRRIIDKNLEVDFNELLHGGRDLWSGMTLPVGRQQVEILWACVDVIRQGVKK